MNYRLLVRIPTVLIVVTKMLFVLCILAQAASPSGLSPEIEAARLRIKLYEGQEYPLKRRLLNSKINIAKARVESLQRQHAEYQQFTKFKYSAPLFGQLEHVKVAQVEAEEHLKNLIEEKSLLERFHQDQRRLLELELKILEQAAR